MSLPLGYVFWHRARPGVSRRDYETKLLAFQSSLKAHPPDGFVDAVSFREATLPWSTRGSAAYEDWYLVSDFQSLGALNEAAVDVTNRRSHDEVAKEASEGYAGLYRLRRSDLRLHDALFSTWMRKPARMPYQAFLEALSEIVAGRRTDLWQRQMVLGPTAEFCVHSDASIKVPKVFHPATVRVRSVSEDRP